MLYKTQYYCQSILILCIWVFPNILLFVHRKKECLTPIGVHRLQKEDVGSMEHKLQCCMNTNQRLHIVLFCSDWSNLWQSTVVWTLWTVLLFVIPFTETCCVTYLTHFVIGSEVGHLREIQKMFHLDVASHFLQTFYLKMPVIQYLDLESWDKGMFVIFCPLCDCGQKHKGLTSTFNFKINKNTYTLWE